MVEDFNKDDLIIVKSKWLMKRLGEMYESLPPTKIDYNILLRDIVNEIMGSDKMARLTSYLKTNSLERTDYRYGIAIDNFEDDMVGVIRYIRDFIIKDNWMFENYLDKDVVCEHVSLLWKTDSIAFRMYYKDDYRYI